MSRWISVAALSLVAALVSGLVTTSLAQRRVISALRPSPADPTIVRVNGTRALTATLLPAIAAQQKMGTMSIDRQKVNNGDFDVLGFGATWETYLTDISLGVPVAANSLNAKFKTAPANKGEIDTDYKFKSAQLTLKFHIKTSAKTPLDAAAPDVVKQWTTIKDVFSIAVTGFAGEFDLTLKKSGDFVAVETIDKFNAQVDQVLVADSGRLVELAQGIVSLAKLFGVTDVSTVHEAATKLANKLLREELDVRKELRDAINDSLRRLTQAEFGAQTFSVGKAGQPQQQGQLTVSGTLQALQTQAGPTASGQAVTQWNVDVQARPTGAVPTLAYSPLARPAQDAMQSPAQGDVEVFAPYSLMDKTMYELVQMGSLRTIPVPRTTASGVSVGFDLKVEPTEVPRVRPAGTPPDVVVVEFGARMADTQVGAVKTAPSLPGGGTAKGPTPVPDPRRSMVPESIPVTLKDGGGRVGIQFRVRGGDGGGLYLQYVGVSLYELTGALIAGSTTAPLTQLRTPLQNAIDAHLRQIVPRVTLIRRALQIVPQVSIRIGEPRLGSRYVGLPLTLVRN